MFDLEKDLAEDWMIITEKWRNIKYFKYRRNTGKKGKVPSQKEETSKQKQK